MTTAAIVAGLIPTALGVGAGARQRSDIAATIIGGQSLCLFLTLLLVPASYSLVEEARERFRSSAIRARIGHARSAAQERCDGAFCLKDRRTTQIGPNCFDGLSTSFDQSR